MSGAPLRGRENDRRAVRLRHADDDRRARPDGRDVVHSLGRAAVKTAFDEIREDEYSVAHEAAQLGLLLTNRVEEHEHLRAANIAYIFRDDEIRRQGRVVAGEAFLVERILQSERRWSRVVKWAVLRILGTTELPDFLILIDRNIWSGYGDEEKLALVDHELSHCWFATEDDGVTQKFHRDGSPWWAIRGHDLEAFCGEVVRNGLWSEDLRAMARVIIDRLSRESQAV